MGLGSESLITEVRDLLRGALVIPSIQRDYVWKPSQVTYLLDSLYRDYPIGSLLIWKTSIDVPLRIAAVLQGQQVQLRPAVLLDGQQRLTSMARVIAPDAVTGTQRDIRFDLDAEEFLTPSAAQRKNPRLLPVSALLADSPQFASLLRAADVPNDDPSYDELYRRVRQVHDIRDYRVSVITVESDDYEEVAEIFARVNSGGKVLSKGDLVYSAIAARWPEGLDTIERFTDELNRNNFAIDRDAIIRLTGLLAGTGSKVMKLISKEVTGDLLKVAWADTETAMRYAVDFFVGECGIPRSKVLTSHNLLITPAFFLFQRRGRMSQDDATMLRRWIYTAMAFSHYSSQVEGKLDIESRLIRAGAPDMWTQLMRRASGPRSVGAPIEPEDLKTRTSTSSYFNLLYVAALRGQARDWKSNSAIVDLPMTSTSKIEYHHIFPKAQVLERYGRELTNQVANLAFISGASNREIGKKLPTTYLRSVSPQRLSEQWVPARTDLWDLDAFPEFLEQRRLDLVNVLNELLGLGGYDASQAHEADSELPHEDDEEELDPALVAPSTRRDVAKHIIETFDGLPGGVELTVSDIVAASSTQYSPGEISAGAVRYRLDAGNVPGVEIIPGSSPASARRSSPSIRSDVASPNSAVRAHPGPLTASPLRSIYPERHAPLRRDVGRHIVEVFDSLPPGAEPTIREVAGHATSQYGANEISQGAISARFTTGRSLPGFETVRGSTPLRIRRNPTSVDDVASPPVSVHDVDSLSRDFHRDMTTLYQRAQREVGYRPTAFIRMVSELGGVVTAQRLVRLPQPSDGFVTLWEAGRLDLAAESLVVQPRYGALFDDEVVERARQRLLHHGFQP